MRRNRYAAAAAGVLACQIFGAQAQSAVTLYGLTDVFAGSLKPSGAPAHTAAIQNGGMTTSYFGLRGREDLGGGLGVFFALESYLRVDQGASGRFNVSSQDAVVRHHAIVANKAEWAKQIAIACGCVG